MTIEIRPITRNDASQVVSLTKEFDDYLATFGDHVGHFSVEAYLKDGFGEPRFFDGILLLVDGQPVGYSIYHYGYCVDKASRRMIMADLFVRIAHQRKGYGKLLMDKLQDICRQQHIDELIWSVWKLNNPALAFYASTGAQPWHTAEEEAFFSIKI